MSRQLTSWFDAYRDYCSMWEPPAVYNKWCALATLSARAGRTLYLEEANRKTFANLYVVLVGPPGVGKGQAMREAIPFIEKTGINISPAEMTKAQMMVRIAEATRDDRTIGLWTPYIIIAEELPAFMGGDAYKSGMLTSLTNLWDCPEKADKETKHGGKDIIPQPYICLLGGTTPSGLFDCLPPGSIAQGFTSRIIFACADYNDKRVVEKPWKKEHDELKARLIHDLEEIGQLHGPMRMTDLAKALWADYYMNRKLPEEEFGDPRLQGYSARKPLYVKKLSMLLSISENDTLDIDGHHVEGAMQMLKEIDETLTTVYTEIAPSVVLQVRPRILKVLRAAAGKTLSHAALFRRFSYAVDAKEFRLALQGLVDEQRIQVTRKDNPNGTVTFLYTAGETKGPIL